ncbi:hypothetical protein LXA43DRAFT_441271 [Ganoderma leucocontextum]|nr:hypothetical protein LXA43DRAFT_441271 [Ganoderma leucocontextum]
MVTFILVPTFAISAFLVGAFPAAYATPLPVDPRDPAALVNRGCRQPGCLFVESSSSSASSTPVATSASAAATGSPVSETGTSDTVEDPPDSMEAVARALGAARPYDGVFSALEDEEPSAN